MPKATKTQYHPLVKVTCANCGFEYELGLTLDKYQAEICGNCHPFYSGKEVLVDTAGRIEKFQARLAAADKSASKNKEKKKERKSRQTLADITS